MRYLCVALATFLTLTGGDLRRASAADEFGSLLVESDPAGASVYVDGRLAGETPLTLTSLTAGTHRVRLVRLGFLENSRVVTITREARATVHARLTDPAPQTSKAAALKIVVLEGEGAVNVIQQKTAVAPVIEVRDRNDQPVSSAIVKFAIRGRQATFGGARTLSVTTDAAGRAAVTSLTPTGTGALHITATAAFQGQTAVATIAQTNVMTLAQAASLAGASAGGSGGAVGAGASAGGAGGGGGLSTTTLAIVGGAAAGGAIAAKKIVGGGTKYSGPFSGPLVQIFGTCSRTDTFSGKVDLELEIASDGKVTGQGSVTWNSTLTSSAGCPGPLPSATDSGGCCPTSPQVTGTKDSMNFSGGHPGNGGTQWTYDFTGASSGSQITGILTLTIRAPTGLGSARFPVTLQQ
jgi:hypothetical protein